MKRAKEQSAKHNLIVCCMIPFEPCTKWWREYVSDKATFVYEDFSDIKTQHIDKLIKLRDRRKQNWMEMQQAAIVEYKLYDEAEQEIKRRLGLL